MMLDSVSDSVSQRAVEFVSGNERSSFDYWDFKLKEDTHPLPKCKTQRTYSCTRCPYFTQNPRVFLHHLRDFHDEQFKIYECPYCVYASRHTQKLLRHMAIVHESKSGFKPKDSPKTDISELMEEVSDESSAEENTSTSATIRKNLLKCDDCFYVTHIKSRFTKHVKYHSMPRIKCTECNFRTPYKWNLDRHMKNHGGSGHFSCSQCNFTADIKQSLTVHELNHHNAVLEDSGDEDARRSDIALYDENSLDCEAEMELCSDNSSVELYDIPKGRNETKQVEDSTPDCSSNKKLARPIPNLIPIAPSTSLRTSPVPPQKKSKRADSESNKIMTQVKDDLKCKTSSSSQHISKELPKKKIESFYEKLKERLLSETGEDGTLKCKNCGFESKCLSEHSVHEKNCPSASAKASTRSHGSTRCQHCRHRCKSSTDLMVHLKSCPSKQPSSPLFPQNDAEISFKNNLMNVEGDVSALPHPMENKVFVWNTPTESTDSNYGFPLEIHVNDSTLTGTMSNDCNIDDLEHSQDGSSISPSPTIGKKVFKCPHCVFFAATASRFHVHIVGHLNKKPFECSLCKYRSNWRWDITKHIRLKSVRDSDHLNAKVLMTDETGRRNYTKYNKYLTILNIPDTQLSSSEHKIALEANEENMECVENYYGDIAQLNMPLDTQKEPFSREISSESKPKKTLWKCKKCFYKHPSKEELLKHVHEHSGINEEYDLEESRREHGKDGESQLAYRCGHCFQISNWKHVIQRHCRLKHHGVVKVEYTDRSKLTDTSSAEIPPDTTSCYKCPFRTTDREELVSHAQQHVPSPDSVFKCYFCPYFVKNEIDLMLHLPLHGIHDPEGFVSRAMGGKTPELSVLEAPPMKRYKCSECPYESNSRSQFLYHEQFHRLPTNAPYKCQICNYSVTKRHLLAQHMKVHMSKEKREDNLHDRADIIGEKRVNKYAESLDCIPYVWVLAKNEYHKMFRCRYCSYVNSQLDKIPYHEKMHCIDVPDEDSLLKCLECKFTCDNAPELTDHCKIHGEIYGRIYCHVNLEIPDEDQVTILRELYEEEQKALAEASSRKVDSQHEDIDKCSQAGKQLYFCSKCPARFFHDTDWKIHNKFHDLQFPMQCRYCSYTVPQDNQLAVHNYVHTEDYRSKTLMLEKVHETHPDYIKPRTVSIPGTSLLENLWVVDGEIKPPKKEVAKVPMKNDGTYKPNPKPHSCKICPARFCKTAALNYHNTLHGSGHPYKCKTCNFAVNTLSKLSKHEKVHDIPIIVDEIPRQEYDSGNEDNFKDIPLSGTDLFQRKTEAQKRGISDKIVAKPNHHFPPVLQADTEFGYLMHGNPAFIYPTYMKNGRQREKRYKCHKCPSAFEKREQYKVHLSLHGSKQRYKCDICDYSVKYYANYVQHMRKHQINADAQADRKTSLEINEQENAALDIAKSDDKHQKVAVKTMTKPMLKTDFEQFSARDQQTLRLLQKKRVEIAETSDKRSTSKKTLFCLKCPFSCSRLDQLNIHIRSGHSLNSNDLAQAKKKNCSCCHCNFIASRRFHLKTHIKCHFDDSKRDRPEFYMKIDGVQFQVTRVNDNVVKEKASAIEEDLMFEESNIIDSGLKIIDPNTGEILQTWKSA